MCVCVCGWTDRPAAVVCRRRVHRDRRLRCLFAPTALQLAEGCVCWADIVISELNSAIGATPGSVTANFRHGPSSNNNNNICLGYPRRVPANHAWRRLPVSFPPWLSLTVNRCVFLWTICVCVKRFARGRPQSAYILPFPLRIVYAHPVRSRRQQALW